VVGLGSDESCEFVQVVQVKRKWHDPEMAREFLVGERCSKINFAARGRSFQRHFFGRSNSAAALGVVPTGLTRVQQSVQILDAGCDGFTLHQMILPRAVKCLERSSVSRELSPYLWRFRIPRR